MKRRHTRPHPCPVCGGYDGQHRGSGKRCGGFTTDDGYAHCARIPCGEMEEGGTFAHRLNGSCRCGQTHGSVIVETRAREVVDHVAAWQSLERRSLIGERYLQQRGLDPHELRERDAVRFHRSGSVAVALRDLATGDVCGIQYRRVDGGEPKNLTARGSRCSGAAFCSRLAELDPGGVDVAVIVEGATDSLAALLAFPSCAVFGAHSAGQLASVAAEVAPAIRAVGGWLLLVPHDDEEGVRAGVAAVRAASASGLMFDVDLHLVDLGEHKDLADAWKAGWRWQWPAEHGGIA